MKKTSRNPKASLIAGRVTKNAPIYLRVLTDEQERTGLGLDAQEERGRAYLVTKGRALEVVYRDEGTARATGLPRRPGVARLLQGVRAGRIDAVVVAKLDRLGRRTSGVLETVECLGTRGVDFVSVEERFDTPTSTGRFIMRSLASVAEIEREMTTHRTMAALRQMRTRGEKTRGTVPFGFNATEGEHLVPTFDEQDTLVLVRRLREEGRSLRSIAGELEARGIRTKTGGLTWAPKALVGLLERVAE